MTTCPVRALTPEVHEILREFELTHELTATLGAAWWRLARLPRDGGLGSQDARLMAALEYVRDLENEYLASRQKKGDPQAELEKLKTH